MPPKKQSKTVKQEDTKSKQEKLTKQEKASSKMQAKLYLNSSSSSSLSQQTIEAGVKEKVWGPQEKQRQKKQQDQQEQKNTLSNKEAKNKSKKQKLGDAPKKKVEIEADANKIYDNLARVLEGGDNCAAVCLHNGTLYVANNSNSSGNKDFKNMKRVLNHITGEAVLSEEEVENLFYSIAEQINKTFNMGRSILKEEKLKKLCEYVCAVEEPLGIKFKDLPNLLKLEAGDPQGIASCNLLPIITRLKHDFNRVMAPGRFKAENWELIESVGLEGQVLHAEMKIIQKLFDNKVLLANEGPEEKKQKNKRLAPEKVYIGISKLQCFDCFAAVKAVNEHITNTIEHSAGSSRDTHELCFSAWGRPRFIRQEKPAWLRGQGGAEPALYKKIGKSFNEIKKALKEEMEGKEKKQQSMYATPSVSGHSRSQSFDAKEAALSIEDQDTDLLIKEIERRGVQIEVKPFLETNKVLNALKTLKKENMIKDTDFKSLLIEKGVFCRVKDVSCINWQGSLRVEEIKQIIEGADCIDISKFNEMIKNRCKQKNKQQQGNKVQR